MEKLFNIGSKILLFLQDYTKSNFGSAVVGFLLSVVLLYYGVIKNTNEQLEYYREEHFKQKRIIDSLNIRVVVIQEETRLKTLEDNRAYFEYVYNLINNMKEDINSKKNGTLSDIVKLEKELKNRKEEFEK